MNVSMVEVKEAERIAAGRIARAGNRQPTSWTGSAIATNALMRKRQRGSARP
jgi:hypothetical protein